MSARKKVAATSARKSTKTAPQQAVAGLTDVLAGPPKDYAPPAYGDLQAPPAAPRLALAYTFLLIAAALTAGYALWFVAGAALAWWGWL